jgi:hypothetical protein
MTTIINASSSAGLVQTADTSAILQLQTGNTAALTVDASQNVGIGTASPAYNLQVSKTVAAGSVISQINNPSATGAARLYLGNDSGESAAYFQVFGSTHAVKPSIINIGGNASYPLVFDTAGTERMRINAGAPVLCLAGGNTSATGTGIAFPATQSASSDANCLDDYEEGTWSPSVGGNATYSVGNSGTYIKVGKMVTVNFDLQISTLGTGSTTAITNFPFASDNTGFPRTGCCSYYAGLTVSPIFIAFYLSNNSTANAFVWNTAGSATVGFNSAPLFANGSRITGAITYTAAS